MPRVGLSVLPEDAERALAAASVVREAGPQHLNLRVDLRDSDWRQALAAYGRLAAEVGAEAVLEVVVPGKEGPASELEPLAEAVRRSGLALAAVVVSPAADLKSYPPGTPLPPGLPSWEEIAAAARAAFPGVRLGGGMLSNFTELNRKRPPTGLFDFVTHATSSLVHAADDRSVMETLEAIGHVVGAAQALAGGAPCRIGPSHIGNSFNPYGSAVTANPDNGRVTMARVEPRHRGLFGAAWHLGFLSQAAAGGVEAATVASPVGEFGLAYTGLSHAQPGFDEMPDAAVYPVFHVVKAIAGAAGAPRVEAASSDEGRLRALAWETDGETQLWLANLRDIPVEVAVQGFRDNRASLRLLDETSFDEAVRNRLHEAGPVELGTVTLRPYAVACLRGRT